MPYRNVFTVSLTGVFGLSVSLMVPTVASADEINVHMSSKTELVEANIAEASSSGSEFSGLDSSLHTSSTPAPTSTALTPSVNTLVTPRRSNRTPIERRPVYFGVGLGAGISELATSSLGGTPLAGSFNLRLGGVIKDQYMLGVQGSFMAQYYGWEESKPTGSMLSGALGEFSMFPLTYLPWNLNFGVGWGSAAKVDRRADVRGTPIPVIRSGNGVAWMAGSGWDFFTQRKKKGTLGLQVRYEGTQSANLGVSHGAMFVLWANIN